MKQAELARWLKAMVILAGCMGLFVCFLLAPSLGQDFSRMNPEHAPLFWPCLLFIWLAAVPFYWALVKIWMICREIISDNSFCRENAQRMRFISQLGIIDCIWFFLGVVLLLIGNLLHPGILIILLIAMFVSAIVAAVAAVLSHLVEKAADIKKENELTI